ncbi:MAG: hypothetical protein KDD43_09840 [Bdellovibrionales bacterium]|nr:hypothetical protein [Bdellovibrionales bacterium]
MKSTPEPRERGTIEERFARIAIIGNGGGGKTALARKIALRRRLPITHVDSIQYLSGFEPRPEEETRQILDKVAAENRWIIDGFGPLDVIERRFERADLIIFVNFPVWRHYWWAAKRQLKSFWHPRSELPQGCSEASIGHTIRLFKILSKVDEHIVPVLEKILSRKDLRDKVIEIKNVEEWNLIFEDQF